MTIEEKAQLLMSAILPRIRPQAVDLIAKALRAERDDMPWCGCPPDGCKGKDARKCVKRREDFFYAKGRDDMRERAASRADGSLLIGSEIAKEIRDLK